MQVAKEGDKRMTEDDLAPHFDATHSRSPWC
jgi:hypothetical protein